VGKIGLIEMKGKKDGINSEGKLRFESLNG
jgi:hypothetical protein